MKFYQDPLLKDNYPKDRIQRNPPRIILVMNLAFFERCERPQMR